MDKQTVVLRLKALQSTYRANPEVLRQLSHINLLAVVGPTGAGKSTVVRQSGLPFVVGDTTRAPRENEIQGRDYNFRTDAEAMLREIERGEFVQFVVQRETEVYGTKASSYPSTGACAMSVLASEMSKFLDLGFGSVTPIYMVPPNHTEWMHRIAAHKDKDLDARLMEAKESLSVALEDPKYVYIINDDLASAVEQMKSIARGVIDPNASARAKTSAKMLFEHLEKVIR